MKANNGSGNNEGRDTWETPKELWDELNKQYGLTIDCCASSKNRKCLVYYDDFISQKLNILNNCWMNPPFSKAYEMFEHFFKVVSKGVAIYRCDNMETKVWQDIILKKCDWVFIPKGRVSYEGMEGNGSRFPSALIGIGLPPPKNLKGELLVTKR